MAPKLIDMNPVSSEEMIQNDIEIHNWWKVDSIKEFQNQLKEQYKGDIWFTGNNRSFERKIASSIDEAKEMIVVSSFLLQQTKITDALLLASRRGVRVYIITASENQLEAQDRAESELDAEKIEEHKSLLESLRKRCLIRTAPHFHAKYILIDPRSNDCDGYMTSANLTQKALSKNVEIGLKLNHEQIRDLFNLFCFIFWKESSHEYLIKGSLRKLHDVKDNTLKPIKHPSIIAPRKVPDFKEAIINLLNDTKGDVYISTFSIEQENDVFKVLLKNLQGNRSLHLYIQPKKKDLEALATLSRANAVIKGHPSLHFKSIVIDCTPRPKGMIFTGNLTKDTLDGSHDIGVYLTPDQSEIILSLLKSWNRLLPASFFSHSSVKDLQPGTYWKWEPKKEAIDLVDNKRIDLGEFQGNDLKKFKDYKPDLKVPEQSRESARTITFTWKNVPPKLPKGAKVEDLNDKSLPKIASKYVGQSRLYSLKGQRFFVYSADDPFDEVDQIAKELNARIVVK